MKTQTSKSSVRSVDSSRSNAHYAAIIPVLTLLLTAPTLGFAAANRTPNAVISVSASSGNAPFATIFDATKSKDSDGAVVSYNWTFGDGSTSKNSVEAHTYTQSGTFKASLKVTDNRGASRLNSVTITVKAAPVLPTGVYSVIGVAAPVSDNLLNNPDVAGVILRDLWSNIETQEGVYNWSYLDEQIERVGSAGKKVSLLINSGGQSVPAWVMNLDVQPFVFINGNRNQDTFNTELTTPVFWDPVFLEKKIALIRAAGQRYANNPNVVMVDSQCGGATTADWNVPSSAADIATWMELGFTSDKLLQACEQVVDATMAAFPNQTVKMAVGSINVKLDTYADPDYVAVNLINYVNGLYPDRFIAEKYCLSATTTDPLTTTADLGGWQVLYDYKPNIAAQMLWLASDITSCRMNGNVKPCDAYTMLDKSVNTAINFGMQFLEIYQGDIDNPQLSDIIHYAATTLGTR